MNQKYRQVYQTVRVRLCCEECGRKMTEDLYVDDYLFVGAIVDVHCVCGFQEMKLIYFTEDIE